MLTTSPECSARHTSNRIVRTSTRAVSPSREICPDAGLTHQLPTRSMVVGRRSTVWPPASLLLPLRVPHTIGAAFHAHPPLAGIAIKPPGQEHVDRARSSLPAFLRPLPGEREFHVSVAPGAGNRAALPQ